MQGWKGGRRPLHLPQLMCDSDLLSLALSNPHAHWLSSVGYHAQRSACAQPYVHLPVDVCLTLCWQHIVWHTSCSSHQQCVPQCCMCCLNGFNPTASAMTTMQPWMHQKSCKPSFQNHHASMQGLDGSFHRPPPGNGPGRRDGTRGLRHTTTTPRILTNLALTAWHYIPRHAPTATVTQRFRLSSQTCLILPELTNTCVNVHWSDSMALCTVAALCWVLTGAV